MSGLSAESYLGEDDIADIRADQADGFATRLALVGVVIQLDRDGELIGDPVPVVLTFADRQATEVRSGDGAEAMFREGTIEAYAPWDIREGDVFRLGDVDALVTSVQPIPISGTVTASFQMGRVGYGA